MTYPQSNMVTAEYSGSAAEQTFDPSHLWNKQYPTNAANSIVCVGDSTTLDGFSLTGTQTQINDNIAWWAAAYSKNKLTLPSSCSVGGWGTDQVDTYWKSRVADKRIKFVVLSIGLNNIGAATDTGVAAVDTKLRTWYEGRVKEVLAWGGIPIVQTTFPWPTAYSTATVRTQMFLHNRWRRQLAKQYGIPLLDVESMCIDPTNANGDPYTSYFQPNSPHPGKELIRQIGYKLWNNIIKYFVGDYNAQELANRYAATTQIFPNPSLTGTGGNINGGNVASVLADNVWGWSTSTGTTYSIDASTDSEFGFTGAPVKGNWQRVTTDVSTNAVAPNGNPNSSSAPGLLFYVSGLNFAVGDIIRATAEIEIVTPNTLNGISAVLMDNGGTQTFTSPLAGCAFTPSVNADNAKSQLLDFPGNNVYQLPEIEVTVTSPITGGGFWLIITPSFTGLSGATGNSVWRVRDPRVWRVLK